jgi:hypothetical protein
LVGAFPFSPGACFFGVCLRGECVGECRSWPRPCPADLGSRVAPPLAWLCGTAAMREQTGGPAVVDARPADSAASPTGSAGDGCGSAPAEPSAHHRTGATAVLRIHHDPQETA